jgi:hypothetical protein
MRFDKAMTADGVEALRQYRTAFDEKGKIFADTPHCDWTTDIADAARATWCEFRGNPARDSDLMSASVPI